MSTIDAVGIQEQEITRQLKTLIRGLSQGNLQERYSGYKALYKIGERAIPYIRQAFLKSDWSKVKYPGEIRYVSGLVSLLYDISEAEGERAAQLLISTGCDVSVKQVVASICKFKRSDYFTYEVGGVTVFEQKGLTGRAVQRDLEGWLGNVPARDLEEVERVYVITPDGRNNLGSYTPTLCKVILVWDNPFSRHNPLSWLMRMGIEHTLYHEIGHHVHRHQSGQIPEQEEEADAYASRLMALSHPLTARLARVLNGCWMWLGLKKRNEEEENDG